MITLLGQSNIQLILPLAFIHSFFQLTPFLLACVNICMYVLGDVYVYGDKILAHVVKGSICNGQAFSLPPLAAVFLLYLKNLLLIN